MPHLNPGSILLGSTRAHELREWYRSAVAPGADTDGPIVLGDFWLVIEQRDDVGDSNPEPGRSILNFHVDDFAAAEAQLDEAGVTWVAAAEDRPSGRFATFRDPDGNLLQIIHFHGDSQ